MSSRPFRVCCHSADAMSSVVEARNRLGRSDPNPTGQHVEKLSLIHSARSAFKEVIVRSSSLVSTETTKI